MNLEFGIFSRLLVCRIQVVFCDFFMVALKAKAQCQFRKQNNNLERKTFHQIQWNFRKQQYFRKHNKILENATSFQGAVIQPSVDVAG